MPRHHSPDQKADAIRCLDNNGGDILSTAAQTGIPAPTLYTWRRELWIQRWLRTKRQHSLVKIGANLSYSRRPIAKNASRDAAADRSRILAELLPTRWRFSCFPPFFCR